MIVKYQWLPICCSSFRFSLYSAVKVGTRSDDNELSVSSKVLFQL